MLRGLLAATLLLSAPHASRADVAPRAAVNARTRTATDVVLAFERAGLPVLNVVILDAASDPNRMLGRPGGYLSKATFFDGRHPRGEFGDDDGQNTVEVFATPAAAKARRDYIARVTRGIPYLTQYMVLNGRVLARFDKALLPDEVEGYRLALAQALTVSKTVPVPAAKGRPSRAPTQR